MNLTDQYLDNICFIKQFDLHIIIQLSQHLRCHFTFCRTWYDTLQTKTNLYFSL